MIPWWIGAILYCLGGLTGVMILALVSYKKDD